MKNDRTDLFENYSIPKAVAVLAIPSALCTLVMILYNLADTYFVGRLGDPVESAAVSLAATVLLAFNAVNNLFGIGASSMMSRSLGKRDYDAVRLTSSFSFYLALTSSLLIAVIYSIYRNQVVDLLGADIETAAATGHYLFWTCSLGAVPAIMNVVLSSMVRSQGEAMHAGIGVISGCIMNIILDPFFILPQFLNMGAEGAGLATFISNSFAMLYFLTYIILHRKSSYISLSPMLFRFDRNIFKEVFGVGVPASIQNLLNVTGTLILNNFTAVYGASAVSAMGIAHKINMMPMYLAMGITQGVMPLISYNFASGNRKRMQAAISFVLKISIFITVLIMLLFMLFPAGTISMFMDNTEVVRIGGPIMRAMCLCIPFLSIDFTGVMVFQSIGNGRYSLVFAVLRKIVLEIPAIIIFDRIMPLYGMAYAQPFAEFVLAIAAAFMLRKIFRMKDLTAEQ